MGLRYICAKKRCLNNVEVNIPPTDNGCNDQYEGATSTLCVRASAYPETYEDAQARCNLEGGQLFQDISQEVHVRPIFQLPPSGAFCVHQIDQ